MNYDFRCNLCKTTEEKEIPLVNYDQEKDKQKCNKCGGHMDRVIHSVAMSIHNLSKR